MPDPTQRTVLITGGAGFVGSNLAQRLLAEPATHVRILDDLSRSGVTLNLAWLQTLPGADRLTFVEGSVCDPATVTRAVSGVDEIFHLAAQVAVTTSLDDPRSDFESNLLGTFQILEAARLSPRNPFLLFTSTNKVYGSLHGVPVAIEGSRYRAVDPAFQGVTESEPLDFHSPYGCSKGAADQYVHDYSRIFGLPTVVFRMSCIAGPRQFGTEDQGWVAHFLYSALERRPITIFGDGFQVRDILHVHDLVDAMLLARDHRSSTAGNVYNLGGGPSRAVSIVEALHGIERETGVAPILRSSEVRPGDQPLYVSDTGKLTAHTGWQPRRSWADTLRDIHSFWLGNRHLISSQRGSAAESAAELIPQEVA